MAFRVTNPNILGNLQAGMQMGRGIQDRRAQAGARDIYSRTNSILNMQGMERGQALQGMLANAQQAGNREEYDTISQLLQMDSPTQEQHLQQLRSRAGLVLGLNPNQIGGMGSNKPTQFQKTGSWLVKNKDDTQSIVTGVFNPDDGSLSTSSAVFGANQLVSNLGETGDEQSLRRIGEARDIERVKNESQTLTAADKETQKKLGMLRGAIRTEETKNYRALQSQGLQFDQLERALESADTGKWAELKTWAGQYMPGVDIADEQALASLTTKYALAELRLDSGTKTDMDFLKTAMTQITTGNTKEANRMILGRMKEDRAYGEARWNAWRKFSKRNKNFEEFEDTFKFTPSSMKAATPTSNKDIDDMTEAELDKFLGGQ